MKIIKLGFRAGDTTAVFDVTLTTITPIVSIPEVQTTPADPIVVMTTIDPPMMYITQSSEGESGQIYVNADGGKYVEDFSYMVF
jgi:hypothetical protein